jgi:hypothetical protein
MRRLGGGWWADELLQLLHVLIHTAEGRRLCWEAGRRALWKQAGGRSTHRFFGRQHALSSQGSSHLVGISHVDVLGSREVCGVQPCICWMLSRQRLMWLLLQLRWEQMLLHVQRMVLQVLRHLLLLLRQLHRLLWLLLLLLLLLVQLMLHHLLLRHLLRMWGQRCAKHLLPRVRHVRHAAPAHTLSFSDTGSLQH